MSRRMIFEHTPSGRYESDARGQSFSSLHAHNTESFPRASRRLPEQESRPRFNDWNGGDGGFMSMSRFASMSFDEARSGMHSSVQNMHNASLPRLGRPGLNEHVLELDPMGNLMNSVSSIFGGFHPVGGGRNLLSRGMASRRSNQQDPNRLDEYQMLQLLDEGVVKRGVSERRLRAIPVKLVDRKLVGKEKCHICQCEYQSSDKIMELQCKHCYHPDCIKGWFKENRTCPVCRFEVEA